MTSWLAEFIIFTKLIVAKWIVEWCRYLAHFLRRIEREKPLAWGYNGAPLARMHVRWSCWNSSKIAFIICSKAFCLYERINNWFFFVILTWWLNIWGDMRERLIGLKLDWIWVFFSFGDAGDEDERTSKERVKIQDHDHASCLLILSSIQPSSHPNEQTYILWPILI